MRKIIFATILVFTLILGYAAVKSNANEMTGESWGITQEADKPLGAAVKNEGGEFLGVITDFVSDSDGRISFAILLFGKDDDYGEGGRQVAVPFSALSCAGQECLLDSGYAQLASSPVFISKDELADRQMAENIYRYFGVQPYWTEKETTEHEMAPDVPGHDYDY